LETFFCAKPSNDLPDEYFGLGAIPPEILSISADLLFILEALDWRWPITTILEQPADLLYTVLRMKSIGEILRRQHESENEDD
jgi:hypothetical protein